MTLNVNEIAFTCFALVPCQSYWTLTGVAYIGTNASFNALTLMRETKVGN